MYSVIAAVRLWRLVYELVFVRNASLVIHEHAEKENVCNYYKD